MKFDDIKWIEVIGNDDDDHTFRYLKEKVDCEIRVVENKLLIYINGEQNEKLRIARANQS
jgi:hypothetical protein